MKTSIFTGIVAATLVLSACSSAPTVQPTWQKVGISKHDTHSAIQKCRYQIGIAKVNNEKESVLFNSCMESEGYRYTSQRLIER